MKTNMKRKLLASAVALACGPAVGAEYWLCAGTFSKTMPDASSVTMWGYADATGIAGHTCPANGSASYTSPGPRLTVAPADPSLTVHLTNNLTQETSLVIPGQTETAMAPVKFDHDGNPATPVRVRSFTHEAAAGGTADYTWGTVANPLRPGSYAYQTGTHPQVQVQMGLFGALTQDAATGQAYAGVPYSTEVMQFYSEIDPALHSAVAGGTYGTAMTSTIGYDPKWFLVNGNVFVDPSPAVPTPISAGNVNETTLIRFFNMGLRSHTMVMQGGDMRLVAEDGHLAPVRHDQYSLMVAAGKTQDVTFTPTATGTLPLYERQHNLTTSTGAAKKTGGLMSFLQVGGTSPNPVGVADPYATDEDVALTVPAPGVLANDTDPDTPAANLTAQLVSSPAHALSFTLNPDGSFSYTPATNYNGPDGFVYKASDGTNLSGDTAVSITVNPVNDPPVAVVDTTTVAEGGTVNIAVLSNDSDVDTGTTLTPVIDTAPTNGTATVNADGTISYVHNGGETLSDSFTYHVTDGALPSATVTVSITVTPVNDAPVAVNDGPYATPVSTVLNVAAPGLLVNDTDVDGPSMNAQVASQPANGTVVVNADGSFSYTPTAGYAGPDSFTYQVNDGAASNNLSNVATVSIDVQGVTNTAPVAVNDTSFLYRQNVLRTVNYAGPLGLGVLANDTDAENQALSAQVVTNPTAGTLTMSANGSFTYLRNGTGNVNFTYRANDSQGVNNLSNIATVTMRTDAPPAANGDNCTYDVSAQSVTNTQRCTVNTAKVVTVNVALNDTDPNTINNIPTDGVGKTVVPGSAILTAVGTGVDVAASACQGAIGTAPGARATIVNNCDGTFTVTIAAGNNANSVTYTYRVADDLGALSNSRGNTLTVQP